MADNKKRNKFNILDIVFVLVLLLIMAYGIFSYTTSNGAGTDANEGKIPVTIGVEVKSLDRHMYDDLKENAKVSDQIQNMDFGTLVGFEIKETTVVTENRDEGKYEIVQIPDKYDAMIRIDLEAQLQGRTLVKNKSALKIGEWVTVRIGNTVYGGTVLTVDYDENVYKEMVDDVR